MRPALLRILSRILIILLAAALVSAGFTLWVNAAFGQRASAGVFVSAGGPDTPPGGGNGGRLIFRQPPGSGLDYNPAARFLRGPGISWWAGLTGLLRNLGLIALVTIGVAVLARLIHWVTRRLARPAPN